MFHVPSGCCKPYREAIKEVIKRLKETGNNPGTFQRRKELMDEFSEKYLMLTFWSSRLHLARGGELEGIVEQATFHMAFKELLTAFSNQINTVKLKYVIVL
uniref:Uncharacterized protein n=1 Tax=Panagrolaimus sp. ES5 TaxID=591445 RepID=A0AC34FEZ5_9BILA